MGGSQNKADRIASRRIGMIRVRCAHLAGDGVPLDGPDAIADLVTAGQVQGAGMALWAHVVDEAVLPLGGDLLA